MSRPTFIRIRTFLVPLAGVALYYFVQAVSMLICASFFQQDNAASLLSEHYGTYIILTAALMSAALLVWLYIGRDSTYRTVKRDHIPPKSLLLAIPIALAMLGISNLYMLGISALSDHITPGHDYRTGVDSLLSGRQYFYTDCRGSAFPGGYSWRILVYNEKRYCGLSVCSPFRVHAYAADPDWICLHMRIDFRLRLPVFQQFIHVDYAAYYFQFAGRYSSAGV